MQVTILPCVGQKHPGYDENGYPTQGNLWLQAKKLGAFGFSRPEDVATNPDEPTEDVVASTGVDSYDVDPVTGNGAGTFGTMYTIETDFKTLEAELEIIYDGDLVEGGQLLFLIAPEDDDDQD